MSVGLIWVRFRVKMSIIPSHLRLRSKNLNWFGGISVMTGTVKDKN